LNWLEKDQQHLLLGYSSCPIVWSHFRSKGDELALQSWHG
jgi:hypothetical protein